MISEKTESPESVDKIENNFTTSIVNHYFKPLKNTVVEPFYVELLNLKELHFTEEDEAVITELCYKFRDVFYCNGITFSLMKSLTNSTLQTKPQFLLKHIDFPKYIKTKY